MFAVGETVIAAVVTALLQRYDAPPDAVKVVDWPKHIVRFPVMSAEGFVHAPGTVAIAVDIGLDIVLSISQLHLVSIFCTGPVWAYVGNVAVHVPPLTLYCNVEPVGHGVPVGAVILPPATVHELLHVLLTIVTLAGAVVNDGHVGHTVGAVVSDALVLEQPVTLSIHLANTVNAVVV